MEIITNEIINKVMDRITDDILKQSDCYKVHKNKQNFLDNVSKLIKLRDEFSDIVVGSKLMENKLK